MSDINKWRLSCAECAGYVYWLLVDTESAPTTCPVNSGHTVNGATIVSIYKENSTYATAGELLTKPTTVKNEHTLKPYGLVKVHFDSADYAKDLTLTNKYEQTFNYSCTGNDPIEGDLIFQADGCRRAYIVSVDTIAGTLIIGTDAWDHDLENSSSDTILSHYIDLDFIFPGTPGSGYLYFWGMIFDCTNHHDNDVMFVSINDPYNILEGGVDARIKAYEESWVHGMAACEKCMPPDGSPGEILIGLSCKLRYYPYDTSSRIIDAYVNHLITELDG